MQAYRTVQWKQFRDDVIRLDDNACVRCRRTVTDGAILQVHHKLYLPNKKPWEYPYESCEALCKACHAAEHGKIPPRFGWDLIGHDDLEDLVGSCELCGTPIRYVFLVQHEKWPVLEVGEVCCDNVTCTQVASDHIDSLRRFSERRKRFVSSPRWSDDHSGNITIKQKKIHVEILSTGCSFRLRMNECMGKLEFPSIFEAKIKAFYLVESGIVSEDYLKKLRAKKNISASSLRP